MSNDIQVHLSSRGGSFDIVTGGPTAASVFTAGVPVKRVAAGTLTLGATPVIIGNELLGITATPALNVDGVLRNSVEVHHPINVVFSSRNYSSGGAGVSVFPLANATALAQIGDGVGFVLTGGIWFVDSGTATNIGIVTGFLDANGGDIIRTGAAAARVLFRITASQLHANLSDAP